MGVLRLSCYAAIVFVVMLSPADAGAQYFGRNKVEHVDFDFRILSSEHFDVYHYAREEAAARMAARLAERWYARISRVLNHELNTRQPLVLYGSQAEFAQTNVIAGLLPDSVGGVTESSRRRIVMPFAPTLAETNRVLGHEIVHAFQFDIGRRHGAIGQPLWFVEGMAEYLARGTTDAEASLWLRDAVLSDRIPLRERDAARSFSPYQYGHAFWSFLGREYGDQVIEKALKPAKSQRKLADRMRYATGKDLDALYAEWRKGVQRQYAGSGDGRDRLTLWSRGSMQLGPALSPDGSQAVFFSERDKLSLDLYLADVKGGRIVRKLATTAASAQFDSLQPLRSTGAWSPDGEWFAFAAVRNGQAALMLLDMRDLGRDREFVFTNLGQVLSATWAPDGNSLAFAALAGGFTDLYVVDLKTGSLRQLTDDPYADLQPAWSHDGRTIAFVSERPSSDLATLRFGRPQLALIDVTSGQVTDLAADLGDAQLNPQWSADDRYLFFVGTLDGVANVFRVNTETLAVHQATNVDSGVSGVTPTSPALSLANKASVLAFTVYKRGRPQLVVVDPHAYGEREPLVDVHTSVDRVENATAGVGLVDEVMRDATTGLPDDSSVTARDYTSNMTLEGIGQPYISSGGGPFGTFVRGGGALFFGDMLGERRVGAAVQIGNRLRDAAFEFRFLNQERRWNWGAIGELEPALRRYRRQALIDHDGQQALLKESDYLQRVQLRAAALVAYPFNRSLRVEFTGGVRHDRFHRDLRVDIYAADTGRIIMTTEAEAAGGVPTTVAEVSAALVHDTAVFGPTGPLLGARYRFEIAPATGDLSYTRVLADFRKYVMPIRPYSVALRVLHSGRYGTDGNDPRLLSSFLGSNYFVRGHRLNMRYCRPDPTRVCGDDLLGNRLLVSNLELRFPLWGMLNRQIEYGPIPADVFLFADGGMVWAGDRRATRISSVGGGVRFNAGGLPVELAAIRSLDGPAPRWLFDFGFRVGF